MYYQQKLRDRDEEIVRLVKDSNQKSDNLK